MSAHPVPSRLLVALVLVASVSWVQAQSGASTTPAPKPATKPAATAPAAKPTAAAAAPAGGTGTRTLEGSGKAGGGKVMTREELRACLKQQDDLAVTRERLEAQRKSLDEERVAVLAEGEALKARRATLGRDEAGDQALKARVTAMDEAVKKFLAKKEEMEAASPRQQERLRKELKEESDRLKAEDEAIKADRAAMVKRVEAAVEKYNADAQARDARATDWNVRNNKLVDAVTAASDERDLWRSECGNRAYREDDEKAIRAGK